MESKQNNDYRNTLMKTVGQEYLHKINLNLPFYLT